MLGRLWRHLRRNRPVWHRVLIVPGDDKKVPHLAVLQKRVLRLFRRSMNYADNPRRQAMQDAVDLWFQLEDAMHRTKEHEKDNEVAIDYASSHRRRDGVSEWFQMLPVPKEGLIPIPPEFKEVKRLWDRAHTDDRGRPVGARLNPDAPPESIAVFYPEGMPTPNLRLDGQQVHAHAWNVRRGNERDKGQGRSRQRGKRNGGNQQGGDGHGKLTISLDDD